ncbi:MAG TPA: sugar ABC transporter ATP-binding protein [Gaiellaceae bacterium]|jgi:ribose transport system ATP-binding protein|nr:sugar ABC transporter ATP-binding protein [Gaiellaceae bacterium]
MSEPATPLLEAREVAKHYGPVVALRSADLSVASGEVHALLGANGAGKSTLVKCLTGVIRQDGGSITVSGKTLRARSPMHAARLGLAPVFQDPALVPDLTVAQNLRLTGTSVDGVRRQLAAMDLGVSFRELVGDLPLPILRMLDLARALTHDPQLLILDEITAALPSDLAERVFDVMRRRREAGRSVLFITHRLAEVIATADRATVLRDGSDVGTMLPKEGGEARIVEMMLGPEAARAEAEASERDEETPVAAAAAGEEKPVVLEVNDLRVGAVQEISLQLRRGEVLGIAALEGQGQDDLFEALAGQRKAEGGDLRVDGKAFRPRHPYDAVRRKVVLVPPDRLLALMPQRSVRENVAAPLYNSPLRWGPINMRREGGRVRRAVEALQIDMRAARQVRRLSGGNQQKVTIARWLASGFAVLLCNDPTRGIDVGTKRQVYALLRELADDGAAILFFSSELAEFPLVCDRVLTVYGGRVTAELAGAAAGEASLLQAMHGLELEEAVA